MNQNQKTILAIDYGTKRIGLAVSHGPLAVPVKVIEYQQQNQAIKDIIRFCQEEEIKKIIIGISEKETAAKIRSFSQKLQSQLSIPIEHFDETLSTKQVKKRFLQRNKALPEKIDHYSAAYILEEWMAVHKNNYH